MTRIRSRRAVLPLAFLSGLLAACSGEPGRELLEVRRLVTETSSEQLALPGQTFPASVETTTLWLGPDLARRDTADESFLIDMTQGLLTHLDHAARAWTSQTVQAVQQLFQDLAADTLGELSSDQRLARLRSALTISARVTPTDQTGSIDGYQCRRWLVEQHLGEQIITSELWLTSEIDLDYDLLHRATRPTLLTLPGGLAAMQELSRLQGVPVRTTSIMKMYGAQTRAQSRLLAVETVRVAPAFFRPPAGYRPTD